MIFSHKRVNSAFKLKMHVKCIQIRTSTALMNVKEFKFTNRQSFIAFGQCFSLLFISLYSSSVWINYANLMYLEMGPLPYIEISHSSDKLSSKQPLV